MSTDSQKVIIASTNPVKVNSTREAFDQVMGDYAFKFEGVSVPSGVSEQPITNEETLKGATLRAKHARTEFPQANYWVGIEGGIEATDQGMEAFAWVVILSADQQGQSRTSTFFLPPEVQQLIQQGVELGHANDQVFNERDSKRKGGAVGTLTKGVLGRTEYYVQAVMLALIPFINRDLYY